METSNTLMVFEKRNSYNVKIMLTLKLFIALICSIIIIIIINTDAADEEVLVSTISTPKHCSSSDSSSSKMIAKTGDTVGVHYTGSIDETSRTGDRGKVFDSSLKKKPLRFELGSSPVIKGWHIGINGMCLGEKRIIQIPPKYGYGNAGAGKDIPGGATLSFEVELVSINDESITPNKAPVPNIFDEMDTDRDFKVN